MSGRWSVRLFDCDPWAFTSLRLCPGVEVCAEDAAVWLCGPDPDEPLDALLRTLAGERFAVLEDGQLIPSGSRVPRGYLPEGPWSPLRSWLAVQLPPARYAASVGERVSLRLVRGGAPAEANVLITTPGLWKAYAVSAPQVRLQGLAFAAAGQEVVVQGFPLPPVRGVRMIACDGIATPAGWTWAPAVGASVLRAVLELASGDLALWRVDGSWTHVRSDDFVRATRSAARLLGQEIDDG